MMMRSRRGQALIETAIFLPFVLTAMTAIIYYSQYGVLQGRAVQAVRYGALVGSGGTIATDPQSNFTVQKMYAELTREGASGQPDPGYPSSGFACNGGGGPGAEAASALNLQQAIPSGVGTAQPSQKYFQTATGSPPVGACTSVNLAMPKGPLGLAASYMILQATSVSATKATPAMLQPWLSASQVISATMSYTVPAAPAPMMYCSQAFGSLMAASFASLPEVVPNVLSTPYGAYPTPLPSPTARAGC